MQPLRIAKPTSFVSQRIANRIASLEHLLNQMDSSKYPEDVVLEVSLNCSAFSLILTSLGSTIKDSGLTLEQMLIMRETMNNSELLLQNYQALLKQ